MQESTYSGGSESEPPPSPIALGVWNIRVSLLSYHSRKQVRPILLKPVARISFPPHTPANNLPLPPGGVNERPVVHPYPERYLLQWLHRRAVRRSLEIWPQVTTQQLRRGLAMEHCPAHQFTALLRSLPAQAIQCLGAGSSATWSVRDASLLPSDRYYQPLSSDGIAAARAFAQRFAEKQLYGGGLLFVQGSIETSEEKAPLPLAPSETRRADVSTASEGGAVTTGGPDLSLRAYIRAIWGTVLEDCYQVSPALGVMLRMVDAIWVWSGAPATIVLTVKGTYHFRELQKSEYQHLLAQVLKEHLQIPLAVRFERARSRW
jgi:hypothetical protein